MTILPNAHLRTAFTTTVASTSNELASTLLEDIKGCFTENAQLNRDRQPNQTVMFTQNHSSALQALAFQLYDCFQRLKSKIIGADYMKTITGVVFLSHFNVDSF